MDFGDVTKTLEEGYNTMDKALDLLIKACDLTADNPFTYRIESVISDLENLRNDVFKIKYDLERV